MGSSLVALPIACQTIIIELLLEHDSSQHEARLTQARESDHYDYGSRKVGDDDLLHHKDLMSWSCTSSYYRNLLAPFIFRSVRLCNSEVSGASVHTLLHGRHRDLVKELYFVGKVPGNFIRLNNDDDNDGDAVSDAGSAKSSITVEFPDLVEDVLSNLCQFPNLDTLSIGFIWPEQKDIFGDYIKTEHAEEDDDGEAILAWQGVVTTTVNALVKISIPKLDHLEIRNLVWTFVEPYKTPGFRKLLNHVRRFSLSVKGGRDSEYGAVNTLPGYRDCIGSFHKLFFKHLTSVTAIKLEAPPDGPAHGDMYWIAPFGLRQLRMPALTSLHYNRVFLCSMIIRFAKIHADTLEEIILDNCMSDVRESIDSKWCELFDGLYDADMKRLVRLEISPRNAPLFAEDEDIESDFEVDVVSGAEDGPETGSEPQGKRQRSTQKMQETLKEDPSRRVFRYVSVDDSHGTIWEHTEATHAAFHRGDDQRAYDRMMGVVGSNAARLSDKPL